MPRAGKMSVWYSLAPDRMGAVVDQSELTIDLNGALAVAAAILSRFVIADDQRIALPRFAQTNPLTGGTIGDLGHRNRATSGVRSSGLAGHVDLDQVAQLALSSPVADDLPSVRCW